MATMTTRTAEYKGRTYRVLWVGATKFGRRAHLQYMDGSKDFWVDESAITIGGSYRSYGRGVGRVQCPECDTWHDEGEECPDCPGC